MATLIYSYVHYLDLLNTVICDWINKIIILSFKIMVTSTIIGSEIVRRILKFWEEIMQNEILLSDFFYETVSA